MSLNAEKFMLLFGASDLTTGRNLIVAKCHNRASAFVVSAEGPPHLVTFHDKQRGLRTYLNYP